MYIKVIRRRYKEDLIDLKERKLRKDKDVIARRALKRTTRELQYA